MSFRVFMRATLQGVTPMGKSRPGVTALRQHVQSLLQGGVGGPLLADGGIHSGGPRTFVPSAPPSPRTMGTAAGVDGAFAVTRTHVCGIASTSHSVPLALLLRGAGDRQNCERD